ncbi:MAG: helix-turn-helix domain-containing protein [Prevotella sp.]|nr:helix-turn-helix domain-containing protein [Prevotella sp.]
METKVLHEITPLGENEFLYVADRHKPEFDYPIHCHEVMELNFVANGAGALRTVGDSSEVIGDLDLVLITSSNLEHVWEQHECKSKDIHEITIQFYIPFEDTRLPFHTNPYKPILRMMQKAKRGLVFPIEAILSVYHLLKELTANHDSFYGAQRFFDILYELSKFDGARELSSSSFAKVDADTESRRVLKVKNYINTHYKGEIRLDDLARLVGMAPTAFSRFFHLRTGKSLSEYIVDVRLGNAARRLVDTTDSVSEICYTCGFNTLSNFNRLFRKRKGCNPTEFREKYHKTKVII